MGITRLTTVPLTETLQAQGTRVAIDVTHKVIFDVASGQQALGSITIALFGKQVPRSV